MASDPVIAFNLLTSHLPIWQILFIEQFSLST